MVEAGLERLGEQWEVGFRAVFEGPLLGQIPRSTAWAMLARRLAWIQPIAEQADFHTGEALMDRLAASEPTAFPVAPPRDWVENLLGHQDPISDLLALLISARSGYAALAQRLTESGEQPAPWLGQAAVEEIGARVLRAAEDAGIAVSAQSTPEASRTVARQLIRGTPQELTQEHPSVHVLQLNTELLMGMALDLLGSSGPAVADPMFDLRLSAGQLRVIRAIDEGELSAIGQQGLEAALESLRARFDVSDPGELLDAVRVLGLVDRSSEELTGEEMQLLRSLARGSSREEIANETGWSGTHTRSLMAEVYSKLGATGSNAERRRTALSAAVARGIIAWHDLASEYRPYVPRPLQLDARSEQDAVAIAVERGLAVPGDAPTGRTTIQGLTLGPRAMAVITGLLHGLSVLEIADDLETTSEVVRDYLIQIYMEAFGAILEDEEAELRERGRDAAEILEALGRDGPIAELTPDETVVLNAVAGGGSISGLGTEEPSFVLRPRVWAKLMRLDDQTTSDRLLDWAEGRSEFRLSPRHQELIELVGAGLSTAAITERLGLLPRFVSGRLAEAYRRLGVTGEGDAHREFALRRAVELGVLDWSDISEALHDRVRVATNPSPARVTKATPGEEISAEAQGGDLTARQLNLAQLTVDGYNGALLTDLAHRSGINWREIVSDLSSLRRHFGVRSNEEASAIALEGGLIRAPDSPMAAMTVQWGLRLSPRARAVLEGVEASRSVEEIADQLETTIEVVQDYLREFYLDIFDIDIVREEIRARRGCQSAAAILEKLEGDEPIAALTPDETTVLDAIARVQSTKTVDTSEPPYFLRRRVWAKLMRLDDRAISDRLRGWMAQPFEVRRRPHPARARRTQS